MVLVIDNSNLRAGGGIQVAVSFLNDLLKLELDNEYHIIQSVNMTNHVNIEKFSSNFHFTFLGDKENSSIYHRIKKMKELENKIKPDAVFTVFGPSYHKSNFPKIVGLAIPFIIYPDSPFFFTIPIKDKIRYKLLDYLKTKFFKRNSDSIVFESDDAKNIFKNRKKTKQTLYTVNNTLNSIFDEKEKWEEYNFLEKSDINILCLSANYPHKNLSIIPDVIDSLILLNPRLKFKFQITSKKEDFNFSEFHNQYISYIGKVAINQLPSLYNQVDILFMPTLLEVFSTTYLEAMFMKVPIIASDMSFARYICGDSARYCQPLNSNDYAENIFQIINNQSLRNTLVENGIRNLSRFGSSVDRTKKYLEIIGKTIESNNSACAGF